MTFAHPGDSHAHSLQVLNMLYEYDDFMESIRSMVDLGCGAGEDLEWWATRTTRDDVPKPLHIRCRGIDLAPDLAVAKRHINTTYESCNFEDTILPHPGGFDILWCHDAFQYALNPLQTLSNWWHIASPGGMLALTIPVTQDIHRRQLSYILPNGCYYHHTLVSLMYMLATAGWDCGAGFFKQMPADPWIHAIVYKSQTEPQNPRHTDWHRLSELGLLPQSAIASVYAHSALRQQDLVLPWIDHSLQSWAII